MAITQEEVRYVADLARLQISDQEVEQYTNQLEAILEHAASISSIDTTGVKPTAHPIEMVNVFRPDEVGQSLSQEQALSQAPAVEDGRFMVPQILGED